MHQEGFTAGHVQSMPLSVRIYHCGGYGQVQNHDLNAAVNLRNAAPNRVRMANAEFTPVDKKIRQCVALVPRVVATAVPTFLAEAGSKS
jgi:transposase